MLLRNLAIGILTLIPAFTFSQTAEELYTEGTRLKTEKRPTEAIAKLQRALTLKPDYTAARYELAWCQNDTKNYTEAISNLRIVRREWATIPKVHFELGYAFEQSGSYDSARASYYRCLTYKPDYSNIYKRLGYVEYQTNNHTTAISHFNKQIEISGDGINDYLFWYRKGYCENATKDYENAIKSLLKSEGQKKDFTNTYLELGFANTKLKKNEDAINWFNKAIALEPENHIPYNGIAEVYRDNYKDIPKAMEWYRKTLAINIKERKGNFGMGYCLNSQGKYTEAMPYLKTAIEQETTYTAAYTELGYSYYKTGNYSDALTNLNKSISQNANSVNPHYYACLVYLAQKNKPKAQGMVNELKRLGSKYGDELQKKVNEL